MRFRLRTLLTQFSLRDLFWLIALMAAISYAYRMQRWAVESHARADQAEQYWKRATMRMQGDYDAALREHREELAKREKDLEALFIKSLRARAEK